MTMCCQHALLDLWTLIHPEPKERIVSACKYCGNTAEYERGHRAGIAEAARVLDAKAAQHEQLQEAADKRRPHGKHGKGDWAPGARWETHNGTAKMYVEAAAAIRQLGSAS